MCASNDDCSICLEPLDSRRYVYIDDVCGHSFHFACLSVALSHGCASCPLCRRAYNTQRGEANLYEPVEHFMRAVVSAFQCAFATVMTCLVAYVLFCERGKGK